MSAQSPVNGLTVNILTVTGLSAGYGAHTVVHSATLPSLKAGTLTALIGPNASGKSTLMKAVAGLIKPTSGTITLGDMALTSLGLTQRAQHIRFVPQVYATQAQLTVFDLLLVARMCSRFGRASSDDLKAAEAALQRVGIEHLADRMVSALSGGQQQLVALAQALTRPASVFLLDEPTSALDLRNQLEAIAIMRSIADDDGRIVVVALHDLNLAARHADQVILLGNGRVIASGPAKDVLASAQCGETYGVNIITDVTRRGSLAVEAYL